MFKAGQRDVVLLSHLCQIFLSSVRLEAPAEAEQTPGALNTEGERKPPSCDIQTNSLRTCLHLILIYRQSQQK